jgi:hypothetical protein
MPEMGSLICGYLYLPVTAGKTPGIKAASKRRRPLFDFKPVPSLSTGTAVERRCLIL